MNKMQCHACGQSINGVLIDPDNIHSYELHQGNALELLTRIPDQSIDAVITDPPYGSGGATVNQITKSSKEKYTDRKKKNTLPDIVGDAIHPRIWLLHVKRWLNQLYRVLKNGSAALVFIDWRNLSAMLDAVQESGLVSRGVVVWDKNRSCRPRKGGFRNQAEYIVWATKGPLAASQDAPCLDGVFRHTTMTNGKVHITQKPLSLMKELIPVVNPGGIILDPFAGSGTTGVAAVEMKRRFLGFEAVPEYAELSRNRLSEAVHAG